MNTNETAPSSQSLEMKVLSIALVLMVAVLAALAITNTSAEVIAAVDSSSQAAAPVTANKPQKDSNSGSVWEELKALGLQGEHHTLNIHGKGDDFKKQDCTVVPDPETGEYSNNIFIPGDGDSADNNQLIMTSGNSKGKWAAEGNTTYGVRDGCTAPFDGDAAELTLPPNEKGYYVTARVLGKPTENPELMLEGSLLFVGDEFGNDLIVLGLVTDNGFETPTQTLTRSKGKTSAVDITGLFEWSGSVCYFDGANYCYDDAGAYTCTDTQLCCIDFEGDGITDTCADPVTADDLTLSCDVGDLTDLACQEYVNEWVFNIGDLVEYMWDLDAQGDFKLANIRFYPVQ